MYEIRSARGDDVDALVQFIDEHWRKNHIFVTDRKLLDWQHRNAEGTYNFVLGVHKGTGEIHGILGFIPTTRFDATLAPLTWMAIWKTHDAARGQKLGRRLMGFLEEMVGSDPISTVAASAMTIPMYEAQGYQIGKLAHFYILHPEKTVFRLIDPPVARAPRPAATTCAALEPISEAELLDLPPTFPDDQFVPRKSPAYIINRYLRHPTYNYQVYRIAGRPEGLVVTRVCGDGEATAIRIVDFLGPSAVLRGLAPSWERLLLDTSAEYLDFYNAGIEAGDLEVSGFTRRAPGDGAVIPNYFEPFAKVNVEIDYMISVPRGTPYRVVKGDSDQDRPNTRHTR